MAARSEGGTSAATSANVKPGTKITIEVNARRTKRRAADCMSPPKDKKPACRDLASRLPTREPLFAPGSLSSVRDHWALLVGPVRVHDPNPTRPVGPRDLATVGRPRRFVVVIPNGRQAGQTSWVGRVVGVELVVPVGLQQAEEDFGR